MGIFALRTARAGLSLARPLATAVSRVMASRVASSSTGLLSTRLFSVSASTSYPPATTKKPAAKTATKKKPAAKKPAAKKPAAKKSAAKKPAAKKPAAKKPAAKKKVAAKKKAAPKRKAAARKKTYTPEQLKRRRLAAKLKRFTPEQLEEYKAKVALKKKKEYLKTKKEELEAIPPPPTRAPAAYALFVQSSYAKPGSPLRSGQSVAATTSALSSGWKALTDAEREEYRRRSEQLRQKWVTAYDEWAHSVGLDAIHKLNRDRLAHGKKKYGVPADLKPTRPPSSFFAFAAEKRKTGEIPATLRPMEMGKRAGELWRQLTPAQKEAYKS